MIDEQDKQTQPLLLEQPKRGRGRPATGHAMTPAEKQKAYRQRVAEQRANQVPAAWHREVRTAADERIEQLEQQLADAINRAEAAEKHAKELERRLIQTLLNVTENPERTTGWFIEFKPNRARKWKRRTTCYLKQALAEQALADAKKLAWDGEQYRIVEA